MTFLPTFLAAALALGQLQPLPGRIEGLVVAEREGGQVPLPFALVAVAGAQRPRTILTDSAGRYALEDLPPGTYGVRVSHIGYKQGAVEVIVPEGSTVQVDLGLAWAPLRLPALRVSMTPREMPPLAMRAAAGGSSRSRAELTLRALEASPGLAEAGLGEAARRLPGNEPRDPTDVLFMRGSTADLKLVLLDGAPVYTPFHLGGLLASFDATSLGDATHHVGGAPARYDGGLSYILDLRTRKPSDERFRTRGAIDLVSVEGTIETPVGPGASALLATRALHGLGSTLAGGVASPYGYHDGLVRGEVEIGPGHDLSLLFFGNRESVRLTPRDRAGGAAQEDAGVGAGRRLPAEASWGNGVLAAGYTARWTSTTVEVSTSMSRYRAELPFPLPPSNDSISVREDPDHALLARGETQRFRVTADATRWRRDGAIRFGASFDALRMRAAARLLSDPVGAWPPDGGDSVTGLVFGTYVDGSRRLAPELNLRAGARLDTFTPGGVRGALRVALLWSLREDALLTLAAGRYHQLARDTDAAVDLAVGDGAELGTAGRTVEGGAPVLSVAAANHLVLSLDQHLTPALTMGLEGFYKQFDGVGRAGSEGLTSSGLDLRLVREGERWTGWLGYAISWFWQNSDLFGVSDSFAGRHLLSTGLRGQLTGAWGVNLQLAFSDGLPLTGIPFSRGAAAESDEIAAPTSDTETTFASTHLDGLTTDAFLRLDAEIHADFSVRLGDRATTIRPYLRVLNALDRRDALFYYFEPWRDPDVRPLAELPFLPLLGVEWRF